MDAADTRYPTNPWGPYAGDPWSDGLDGAAGSAWKTGVEEARRIRETDALLDASDREFLASTTARSVPAP